MLKTVATFQSNRMMASLADGVSERAQTGDEDQVSFTNSSHGFTAALQARARLQNC